MAPPASPAFAYTHALVRGLPASFEDGLKLAPPPTPIDVALAHKQHDAYTALLRTLVPHVVEVPADDAHPDSVFIEDTAIVPAGQHAIATHPGAPSRRGEVGPVKEALAGLGAAPKELQPPALLDGGDVLCLDKHVLVGLSKRTNLEAVHQLSALLQGTGIEVVHFEVRGDECLHFKSLLSAFDPVTLLVADLPPGRDLAAQIHSHERLKHLKIVFVPDMVASNVLSIGPHVVMQDGFPKSESIIRELCTASGDKQLHTLCMSELIKADGALTCCSILLHLPLR